MNELIFLLHTSIVSASALLALWWSCTALVCFIALQTILANLFVTKTISLFGMTATGADAFIIGSVFGFHLLQEYYGRDKVKQVIWISFALLIFYTVMTQIHLAYIPNATDFAHAPFTTLLSIMPRLAAASLISYFIVTQCDYRLYAFLRKKLQGKYLVFRNLSCAATTQLLDTLLFSFLGLYGVVANLGQIIVVSYIIKMIALLMTTPFLALTRKMNLHLPSTKK